MIGKARVDLHGFSRKKWRQIEGNQTAFPHHLTYIKIVGELLKHSLLGSAIEFCLVMKYMWPLKHKIRQHEEKMVRQEQKKPAKDALYK